MLSRQELYSALEQRHGKEIQRKFAAASVVICGLGGLGSNIALSLARAGVGHIHLIDFDRVDISNLNRQQYFISQIGQYKTDALSETLKKISVCTEITSQCVKLTEDNINILAPYEIICEAFDKAEQKAMLVNAVLENFPDKYLISGNGMAGLYSSNDITTRRLSDKFYICGDGKSDISDGMGLVSARVAVCAAHQANMILRIISGSFDA
ncbi:MAG: sulfur carrier protein ThiS adenylyltransferase ThiF [Ruminococcus sp.]|nr:sulfur carrier protein ThiS adenylyltransferase ThiF [Ruminococcus sp.]